MEKKKHYRIISLKEDFGNNKKGDMMRVETTLASRLIDRKVATIYSGETPKEMLLDDLNKETKPKKEKKK